MARPCHRVYAAETATAVEDVGSELLEHDGRGSGPSTAARLAREDVGHGRPLLRVEERHALTAFAPTRKRSSRRRPGASA